jgi:hypothetical protein
LPLRIAFDLDGVLADMEAELVRHAETLFGPGVVRRPAANATEAKSADASGAAPESDAADTLPEDEAQAAAEKSPDNTAPLLKISLNSRQQRRLWRHVEGIEDFWQSLPETEAGIVARLAATATERRWEMIFLTKRPQTAGSTSQLQSQRWLEAKGFPLPSVYVVQGSRGRIAASLALDFVVDDRPENCLDVVVDSKARAILVWRDDEQMLPAAARRLGIGVLKSVGECLDTLVAIDTPTPQEPGVLARVKRLLGLKEPKEPANV